MGTVGTTIDLGELPHGEHAQPAGGWLPEWRRYRWARRRPRRWWPAAVLVAGLAVTATAAAPSPAWATLQFTVPAGGQLVLSEHHLYVIDEADRTRGLSAYRLADGALAWTASHRSRDSWFTAQRDLPLEISMNIVSNGANDWWSYVRATTALEPETGSVRWRREGSLTIVGDRDLGILVDERPSSDLSSWRSQVTVIDLATGHDRWSLPLGARVGLPQDPTDPGKLVALSSGGELTSYDLATGDRLAGTRTAVERPAEVQVHVVGSLVLLHGPGRATVAAYDAGTLHRRWTTELPPDSWLVRLCGPVLCLLGGPVPRALDPATGALAWSADWAAATRQGDTWATLPGPPWPPGRLLMDGWAIDAATGEPVLELGEWGPLTGGPGGPGGRPPWERPVPILVRHELPPGQQPEGRTWFGHLRTGPTRVEVLGVVDGRLTGCTTTAAHLACHRGDELQVWRIRQ